MQRTTRRRLGRALLVLFALMGVAQTTYLAVAGWERQTPVWARAVAFCFPLATTGLFGWYLRRYAAHEHSAVLFAYAGVGTFLGGFAYALPGVGLTIQQQTIGRPILNPGVLLVELWLGGGLLGLAIGHFYGVSLGERRTLERRESAVERHRQRLTVLNRVLRHDIRNRTNLILGHLSNLDRTNGSAGPIAEIETGVRDVLELSETARRIESVAAVEEEATVSVDATAIVERAADRVRSRYPAARITTEFPCDPAVCSNGQLEAALEELLENAVEHDDSDSPEVEVTVSHDGGDGRAAITVADAGPGLPDHERAIFEKREETALKHSTGLGLWLVYWSVENVDGEVRIDDRQPRGTAVTLSLPRPA